MWILVIVGGWAGYRYLWGRYGSLWPLLTGIERPRELADAGVVHGAGVLAKRHFLQENGLGEVPALLQMEDGRIVVLDVGGATVASLPAPRARSTLDAAGTPLRGKPGGTELLAVVGTYSPWTRSVL
jgi:hypothetical protein